MKLAKTFLAIGIAIIFTVFIAYSLYAVYEPPKYTTERSDCYEQYNCSKYYEECKSETTKITPIDNDCFDRVESNPEYVDCMTNQDICEDQFRKTTERYKHARNSFFILLIISIAAIVAGILLNKFEGIGSGLIGGGVLLILWSLIYTSEYWFHLNKFIKVIALGLVLILLIYLGYKKLEKS